MEKERGVQIQIGHIGHDIAIGPTTRQILAEKGMNDVIVVDESNVAEIGRQMPNIGYKHATPLQAIQIENYIPELPDHYRGRKSHKPNKGIKLRSYTFKSHKKY